MKSQRPVHLLAFNKGSQRPCHTIFFDTETLPLRISDQENEQFLKLGWACYIRTDEKSRTYFPEWCFFTTNREFWTFVESKCKPEIKLYLVAHNIGFDFRIVEGFKYTEENDWDLTFFYNKGKTCLLTYRKDKTTLQLLDMTNFYPMSLKAVGEAIGLAKQDVDFATVDNQTLSDYCHRDVEIMIAAWQTWLDFLDDHNLGNFKHTLPSQAFTAYRHRFMQHTIQIHNNQAICELERQAYRGGRTEVFWQGKRSGETFYQLDVNSMYAYVMQRENYPSQLRQHWNSMSIEKLRRLLLRFAVIARVEIETKQPVFPIHTGTRNIYPTGTFETVLTTPELRYALEHGMIRGVGQTAWYRSKPIFREYSTYFANLKQTYSQENNKAFRTIAKLFLNSLYGKFGQRGISTKMSKFRPEEKADERSHVVVDSIEGGTISNENGYYKRVGAKITAYRSGRSYVIGDIYVDETSEGESYNSFPGIAAHVTAYARMYLWKLMLLAGKENVFYTDTDCLIVSQAGYNNLFPLLDDHALGCLKVEKQDNSLTIHAAKDYVLGDKVRTKGIRKNAKKVGHHMFQQEQFLGLPGAIQKGNPDLVTIKTIQKTLSRRIETGHVGSDGWVTPFDLPL